MTIAEVEIRCIRTEDSVKELESTHDVSRAQHSRGRDAQVQSDPLELLELRPRGVHKHREGFLPRPLVLSTRTTSLYAPAS